jgi:DNA topoisomerase VI subunit B
MSDKNVLERTVFETSRLLEFFTVSELSMQIGQSPEWWPVVAIKELIDNALDACENAGIDPEIGVEIEDRKTTITDNAGGIPSEIIERSLDYLVRVSDKNHYISPTRGQLGNAIKCLYAAPYVMSGEKGRVRIESQGIAYDITTTLDRIAQAPVITVETEPTQADCTKFTIWWPESASRMDFYNPPSEHEIVQRFALLNPHARFSIGENVYEPTKTDWQKWKPNNPTSPHWYTVEQLRDLIAAYLTADRVNGQPRTVRELVTEFRGLARTATQKKVTEDAGLHGALLSDLIVNGDVSIPKVERLLSAMKENSLPVNPRLLGIIGEEHLKRRMILDHHVEEESIRYKRIMRNDPLGPYVLEVAFGIYTEEYEGYERTLITGLNWSPTLKIPIQGIFRAVQESRIDRDDPVCLVIHIAKPHFAFTERGKGHINV